MRTARKYRKGRPRRWRESWTVMLEWSGDKYGVQSLIEHYLQSPSDGSGSFLAVDLNDMSWTRYTKTEGLGLFKAVKDLCRARFSPYVRLQLFHDFKEVPIQFGPGGTISMKDAAKGTKRLKVYSRGKTPDFSKLFRPSPRAGKSKSSAKHPPKTKK